MREKFSKSNTSPFATGDVRFKTPASMELYRELMGVVKEIETCRMSV